jgi:hypothetical protein
MSHHPPEKDPIKRQQRSLERLERRSSLLSNLRDDTYCRLGVSKISGVGVLAIKNIPSDVEVFRFANSALSAGEAIEISEREALNLGQPMISYINDMLVKTEYGSYHFPCKGINSIDVSFYLNHSETPNVRLSNEGNDGDFLSFVAVKEIKKGEELTQDYNYLSNDKEGLHKQFPFLSNKK